MRLDDKVAIVTGAGSGFGEGIARRFAAAGAHVVVNDLTPPAASGLPARSSPPAAPPCSTRRTSP